MNPSKKKVRWHEAFRAGLAWGHEWGRAASVEEAQFALGEHGLPETENTIREFRAGAATVCGRGAGESHESE